VLGGHVERCENYGLSRIAYNSYRKSPLSKMPRRGASGVACGATGRTAAGSLFPRRLHRSTGGGRDRFSEQTDGLCSLAEPGAFGERARALRNSPFVVYAKQPFGGPERVLAYLARYAYRTAIANSRPVAIDDNKVAFSYRDYRRGGRSRVMLLASHEFMRRLHVLPDGFHHIRRHGFLAKGERGLNLGVLEIRLDARPARSPATARRRKRTARPSRALLTIPSPLVATAAA
jgi:hypothetical protein